MCCPDSSALHERSKQDGGDIVDQQDDGDIVNQQDDGDIVDQRRLRQLIQGIPVVINVHRGQQDAACGLQRHDYKSTCERLQLSHSSIKACRILDHKGKNPTEQKRTMPGAVEKWYQRIT